MTVNEAVRVLRARWRIALLCLLAALLAAGIVTSLMPRQYTSDVTLYVSLQGEAGGADAAYQASQLAKERVVSYAPLLKDARITQPVIDQLHLATTAPELAKRIAVTVQPDTVVLTATVTDTSPAAAAGIANALAQQFVGLVNDLEQPIGSSSSGANAPPPAKIGVTIIRPATANPKAVSPNTLFNLALGATLGLLLGIGAAFLRNARDTTVRSARRAEELTGAPVLSTVAADRDSRRHPVTLGAHPGSVQVEAYRKLRTNLQFLEPGKPHRVIVVTSATVGEGKSTTACNLALALADAGNRVVLIDVNLRRPQVEQYLQITPTAGVVNVLAGRIPLRRAVGRWVEGGLDVLTAGPVPFNPSELLASRATAALLDEVRHHYDFVILDTPALLPVTDAATVAARADGAVLVVRYGRTVEEQVSAAVAALDAVKAPLLGVVLIGTPPARRLRRRAGSYPEPDRTLLPPRYVGLPNETSANGAPPLAGRPGPALAAAPAPANGTAPNGANAALPNGTGPNGTGPNGTGPNGATAALPNGAPPNGVPANATGPAPAGSGEATEILAVPDGRPTESTPQAEDAATGRPSPSPRS